MPENCSNNPGADVIRLALGVILLVLLLYGSFFKASLSSSEWRPFTKADQGTDQAVVPTAESSGGQAPLTEEQRSTASQAVTQHANGARERAIKLLKNQGFSWGRESSRPTRGTDLVLARKHAELWLFEIDATGKISFEGPVETDQQRAKLPTELLNDLSTWEHEIIQMYQRFRNQAETAPRDDVINVDDALFISIPGYGLVRGVEHADIKKVRVDGMLRFTRDMIPADGRTMAEVGQAIREAMEKQGLSVPGEIIVHRVWTDREMLFPPAHSKVDSQGKLAIGWKNNTVLWTSHERDGRVMFEGPAETVANRQELTPELRQFVSEAVKQFLIMYRFRDDVLGYFEVGRKDGEQWLRLSRDGRVQFEGPVATEEQRSKLAAEVRERLQQSMADNPVAD